MLPVIDLSNFLPDVNLKSMDITSFASTITNGAKGQTATTIGSSTPFSANALPDIMSTNTTSTTILPVFIS